MGELIIGTEQGVYALHSDSGKMHPEEGPQSVSFLAPAGEAVYAVTPDGALWSRTGHNKWVLVNEHPVEEEVWSLGADPNVPGLVYLGVSPAMLYRSTDGGRAWEACESVRSIPGYERWTFPPPPHIAHVRSIAADPHEPGAVYIGVEEGGVYRSGDGGRSWESLNEGLYWDVHTVVPSARKGVVYATTGSGFHRSDDGGVHWLKAMEGLDRTYTVPLVVASGAPQMLYTAAAATPPPGWRTNGTANAALYRSRDGGERWELLSVGLPEKFDSMVRTMTAEDERTVFAASGGDVFYSEDAGEHWTTAASGLPSVQTLAVA